MITPQSVRSLVASTSKLFNSNILVYLDGNLLTNSDGNQSFCRTLTVDERNGLAIDERILISSILYLVTYASESPPDTALDFEVSQDEGITKEKVNFLRIVPKTGFFDIFLLGE
jgi:hypothetical protein